MAVPSHSYQRPLPGEVSMRIDFDLRADTCILRLKGRSLTGSEDEVLRICNSLERFNFRTLRVDCRDVPALDSNGVKFLVGLLKTATQGGAQFELLGPNGRAREVLRICRYVDSTH